jgi:hypothetical protein
MPSRLNLKCKVCCCPGHCVLAHGQWNTGKQLAQLASLSLSASLHAYGKVDWGLRKELVEDAISSRQHGSLRAYKGKWQTVRYAHAAGQTRGVRTGASGIREKVCGLMLST